MLGPFLSLDNQTGPVCTGSAEHAPRHSESSPDSPALAGEGRVGVLEGRRPGRASFEARA